MKINYRINIIGVGPYSLVIADMAEACGYEIDGFYHYNNDRNGEIYNGIKIVSSVDELFEKNIDGLNFALSMGDNSIRLSTAEKIIKMGGVVPSLIHPSVEVSPSATIEAGVILKRNVSIQAASFVGRYSVVCDNSCICHHAVVEEGCFIAGMAVVGAFTKIEKGVFIGQGAIIASGKVPLIGEFAKIGAGSVVVNSIEAYSVVAGNPARRI